MSQKPVVLVPLLCVKCQAAVAARPDEVAWVCERCGQGLALDDTPSGPTSAQPLDIFFSAAIPAGQPGKPFWVSSGRVSITRRETFKGNESGRAQELWSIPRLFFFPGWNASLDEIVSIGVGMIERPFAMQPGSPAPFQPVVTLPTDLRALAEFMVMTIEANRRDMLKRVEFQIELQPAQLWILP